MENYHSDCDINLDCNCHHLGCDQLYALNGSRNNKQKVPVGEIPIGTFLVKICDVFGVVPCPTDFTDTHRFFCVVLMFQVTRIWLSLRPPIFNSRISQIFYFFTFLSFHTDLTDFFTFLLFYLFTFKSLFYL